MVMDKTGTATLLSDPVDCQPAGKTGLLQFRFVMSAVEERSMHRTNSLTVVFSAWMSNGMALTVCRVKADAPAADVHCYPSITQDTSGSSSEQFMEIEGPVANERVIFNMYFLILC